MDSSDEQSLDEIPDALTWLSIKREPPAKAAAEPLLRQPLITKLDVQKYSVKTSMRRQVWGCYLQVDF